MKSGLKATTYIPIQIQKIVATYAAMKSGLKVLNLIAARTDELRSSNLCRDEKRTERQIGVMSQQHAD